MKTLMLIDSNAIIHRSYHAIPKTLKSRRGEQTNAIYGFTTTLIKALEDIKPDYVAASFDVAKKTFRHIEYAEYKATRVAADQELYDQIPRVYELLNVLNIPIYEKEGYEADDCLGTIVQQVKSKKLKVKSKEVSIYIISGDKDIFQLIDGNIFVYNLKKGLSETQIIDRGVIKKEYGLDPEDFIDLKALAGDPSDNIPGVPGIGPKTAITLLQKFDTLKGLYGKIKVVIPSEVEESLESQKISPRALLGRDDKVVTEAAKTLDIKPRILSLLVQYKDQAFMSQKLATIYREVPIDFDLEKSKWGNYDRDKLRTFFEEMSFHSLLKRFGIEKSEEPKTKEAEKQADKDKQLKLL